MFSRRSLFAFAVVTASFVIPSAVATAQDAAPRIATVDPAKIFKEMQETKDLKQKLQNDAQALQAEAQRRQAELEEAGKRRTLFNADSDDFKKASKEFITLKIGMETWQQLIKADMARQQKEQLKSLFEKIEAATKEVAEAKKLDLVIVDQKTEFPADIDQINVDQLRMLINQRIVLFNKGTLDITNDVLVNVDAKYKAKK